MLKNKIIKAKRMISVFLILALMLCGGATVFADIDYGEWNSKGYPIDVMGTDLLIPVKFLTDRKIITGDSDGLFHAEDSINRAEFATMAAKATNNTAEIEVLKDEEIFSDLAGYGWAKPYINAAARAGIFKGRRADKFAPAEGVTYAEVITVLIRMKKGAADSAEGMADKWPDNYIMYAATYNYLGNVVVNDWKAPATRGDVARLMYRALPKTSSESTESGSTVSVPVEPTEPTPPTE